LKEWECVKVGHHKDVGKTIEKWLNNGWRLHTYSCAQAGMGELINHYLLFEREKGKRIPSSAKAASAAAAAAAAAT